jgi:hypothetical protein
MVFDQRIPALSSGHFQEPLELIKNIEKTSKSWVPVLSAGPLYFLLSTLLAAWVFRISGQLLWSSVAPMQLGAWRLRRCISRRAPKIESFFASRDSLKHWGFDVSVCYRSTVVEEVGFELSE